MCVIKLKNLFLKNFKGIKEISLNFEDITNIYGENKLGKTSIYDGFMWLLFDKDSNFTGKFDIRPLDKANNIIHMLETEAVAVLEIDGQPVEFKKLLKEKWVKKNSDEDLELRGTEISCFINKASFTPAEYKNKISSIITEEVFNLISSPFYFSYKMDLKDRRKVILNISMESVIKAHKGLKQLYACANDNDLFKFMENITKRLSKLKEIADRGNKLIHEINELEQQQYLCEKYIKTWAQLIETSINSKFKLVKFKLFNTLIDGQIEECYEALIDGVPFCAANTSSRVNAGIEIINVLSECYDIFVPVFIDNRERVNEITECKSQSINLIVSKDKELVVA
jgi:hypothetical protein